MNSHRAALLWVPVLVAGMVVTAADTASAGLPAGADPVSVTAGSDTSAINAQLGTAASVAGTLKAAGTGTPLSGSVYLYRGGTFIDSGYASAGHYIIGGLSAGTGYAVCISGDSVYSDSATGYLGRCWKTAAWNGGRIPAGATKFSLTATQHKTGVNLSLLKAAAISGRIKSPSGTGVPDAFVIARNRNTGARYYGTSVKGGLYAVKGLPAASLGYQVCVDPRSIDSGTGLLPRCYKDDAWSGGSTFPKGADRVSVSVGHTHTGINISVKRAGAISGKVTDAANGHAIPYAGINIFNSRGSSIGYAQTDNHGKYVARGLAAATGDRVCVYPTSTSPAVRYKGKCWKNTAWSGGRMPSGANAVWVRIAQTHTGINVKLRKTVRRLGSISGRIFGLPGSTAISGADVTVYKSGGGFAGGAFTNATGGYTARYLPPSSTGYVVCARASQFVSPAPPATGWSPRCYKNVAWNGAGVPGSAKRLPLSAGQKRTGINITLPVGGSISGTVTDNGSAGISSVQVEVFTTGGRQLDSVYTDISGNYQLLGLNTGSYKVCFDGRHVDTGSGYRPECFDNVPWNGNS